MCLRMCLSFWFWRVFISNSIFFENGPPTSGWHPFLHHHPIPPCFDLHPTIPRFLICRSDHSNSTPSLATSGNLFWRPGDSSRDLFGMVKTWPFKGENVTSNVWGWKGHGLNHLGFVLLNKYKYILGLASFDILELQLFSDSFVKFLPKATCIHKSWLDVTRPMLSPIFLTSLLG